MASKGSLELDSNHSFLSSNVSLFVVGKDL